MSKNFTLISARKDELGRGEVRGIGHGSCEDLPI